MSGASKEPHGLELSFCGELALAVLTLRDGASATTFPTIPTQAQGTDFAIGH